MQENYKVLAPSIFNKEAQLEQLRRNYTLEQAEKQAESFAKQYNCEILIVKVIKKCTVTTNFQQL